MTPGESLPTTTGESAPVVPLHTCRVCRRGAVRYLGGKRRTFYCEQHGPMKLTDWTRLIPIPVEEYEHAGRLVSTAPPLPSRIASLIDGLVEGLRDVIAQDFPATITPDQAKLKTLEAENLSLRADVARLQVELANANEIAEEALNLWPSTPVREPAPVGGLEVRPAPDPEPDTLTERDFPADTTPKPRASEEPESFPREPVAPAPTPKPGPGYRVTAPPANVAPAVPQAVPEASAEAEPTGEVDRVLTPAVLDRIEAMDVEQGLMTLAAQLPYLPTAPGLSASMRSLKQYDALSKDNKRAVLYALAYLGSEHPEALREEHVSPRSLMGGLAIAHDVKLVALRINRKWRLICEKEGHSYRITEIVDRSDKRYFKSER